jgi:hypothetical protein
MTTIPNRFRLPLSASIEQHERDGFDTARDIVDTARDEEREAADNE